jgi:AcrR family transcriptional regulator
MGVKERHERERARVKRAILDAARALFVAEGFGNVSVRKIGETIEYSPSAIYSYFENRDEIFLALAEEGFRMLATMLETRHTEDPLNDLRQSYWSYYEFSKRHPEYFALIFLERTLPTVRDTSRFMFLKDLKQQNDRALERCVKEGIFPTSTDTERSGQVLWASIHGPAVIGLTWQRMSETQADALAADTLETALAGLQAGVKMQESKTVAPATTEAQRTV